MQLPTKQPKIHTSVTLECDLWNLAKKYGIKFSRCLELGVRIKLAEKGVKEYPNTLMKQKFNKIRELYEVGKENEKRTE